MTLEEKMLRARESRLTFDDITLVVRRPTDLQRTEMQYTSSREAVLGISDYVVGWEGVREMDLVPGGTDAAAPFSKRVFRLWLEDSPKIWEPLIRQVLELVTKHEEKAEASEKN